MELTTMYAIAAGGLLGIPILVQLLRPLFNCFRKFCKIIGRKFLGLIRSSRLLTTLSVLISKHLLYPYLVSRHRLLGPWSRATVLFHFCYAGITLFIICFRISSVAQAGGRAGRLALVNLIFLFTSPHLGFLADLLGFSLAACRRIHRGAAWMVGALTACHIAVLMAVNQEAMKIRYSDDLFAIIGAALVAATLSLSIPYFRKAVYEIFLRVHQAFGLALLYALWRHLPSECFECRLYIILAVGMFCATLIVHAICVLYKNGVWTSKGCPRVLVTCNSVENTGSEKEFKRRNKAIIIQVNLSRPMKVEAGQYVNLWIPHASFWSWAQAHPFMITSWSDEKRDHLDLFVQPRRGLSAELLRHVTTAKGPVSFLGCISGPHGLSEPVERYESVIIIASDFGIAAAIPYLRKLIHGPSACTRRLHFIWQMSRLVTAVDAQPMLNTLLKDDTLDRRYILSISLFVETKDDLENEIALGGHNRAFLYSGRPDYRGIIHNELSIDGLEEPIRLGADRPRSLVMVSASGWVRDEIRLIVRDYLVRGVHMKELEYQP